MSKNWHGACACFPCEKKKKKSFFGCDSVICSIHNLSHSWTVFGSKQTGSPWIKSGYDSQVSLLKGLFGRGKRSQSALSLALFTLL